MSTTPDGPTGFHTADARRLGWLTAPQVAAIDKAKALVVLPIGATEQHGPHLACLTDAVVADEVTRRAVARTPHDVDVWTLPLLPFGTSNEHLGFPGTITFATDTLLAVCRDIGRSVAASGFRKLAFLNGHGGQPQLLDVVARDIRAETGLEVYPIFPYRLGLPDDLAIDAHERQWGIHGGMIETSIMLAIDPAGVDRDAVADEPSDPSGLFAATELLSLEGAFPTAWLTRDISRDGAVGDARGADPAIGEAILDHLAAGVARLFAEICAFGFT